LLAASEHSKTVAIWNIAIKAPGMSLYFPEIQKLNQCFPNVQKKV
jgi:hypothetical protein